MMAPKRRSANAGGRVVDAFTNQPVAGAAVFIVGAEQGGLTQATGRFVLHDVQ